jgi:hypothetical protein
VALRTSLWSPTVMEIRRIRWLYVSVQRLDVPMRTANQ